ncbi:MAG: conserved transrane transport protein, partial [Marmoricola sp.]|nr:conserved transrane transport protein [Marmoricola sp.]
MDAPASADALDGLGASRSTRRVPGSGAVLLIASFGAFLAFLDSTIVNIAFPDIQASFPKSDISSLSWVLNSYNIVFAAFLVAAGRFGDLLGRKRMFIVGVTIFSAASALCAIAGTVDELIGFRVLQGIGAAILVPSSLALVVEGFDPKRRAHGVGLWGAAAAIASGLGPPIGGALVEASSWRLAFLVNVPLGVVAVVLARRGLVESRSPGRRRLPDIRGAVLLAVGLGLMTLGLVDGPDHGWGSPLVLVPWIVAVAALTAFVRSTRTHPVPLIDPAMARIRSFTVGNIATVVAGTGFYAYLLTHVLYLHYVWGYALLRCGLAVAPAALVAAVVASVLGKVADARGHRLIVVPGALVWAGSLLWYLTQVGVHPDFLRDWLPGQLLQGIGVGATLPVLGSAALARLPQGSPYATASAVVSSARQLGAVLGVALLVVLIGTPTPADAHDVLRRGWIFAACCLVLVSVLATMLGPTSAIAEAGPDFGPEPALLPELPPLPVADVGTVAAPVPIELVDLPLFAALDDAARARVRTAATEVDLDAGAWLFRAGDPSDSLYVVRSGRLRVLQDGTELTELGRGDVLGELALLTGAPRSADVRAVRDTRLLALTRADFDSIADLGVLRSLAAGLASRLQKIAPPATAASRGAVAVIAVLALDEAAPVEAVSAALLDQLRRTTSAVDPGRVDRDGLERAELAATKVLLTAGPTDRDWWDFCVRAADRIVVVAGQAPAPGLAIPERVGGADLVLVHHAGSGERVAWDYLVRPGSVHLVRSGVLAADLAPLGARLAGRSLGLVLGGGGARAFAHLGVLDELERAGIRVDRFAGCSVGAMVAAQGSCGWDAATIDAQTYEYMVRTNPIGDYTFPTKALVRGRRTVVGAQALFGERLIEHQPKEFRSVSTDLLRRRLHIHDRGLVADAVTTSLRLPGLYPPLPFDGSLHVDGGVLDNLPVSTLAGPEGPVVAVAISFGSGGVGGRPASERKGPRRVPGLGDTLMRTMMMASGNA